MKTLTLAGMLAASPLALATAPAAKPSAAAPDAAHVAATVGLLKAMQAEKLMRSVAGYSRYGSDAQRQAVFDKLGKVPPGIIHQRLAPGVARVLTLPTVLEMTRFYTSTYGVKVLDVTYNSRPSMYAPQKPQPTKLESKELSRPEYIEANKEFEAAEPKIRHEAFKLLKEISK